MVNMSLLMKQAQEMQKKMAESQQALEQKEYEGQAGGGMVKAKVNGKGHAKSFKIDSSIVSKDEIEMLEDLLVAAFNDAKKKQEEDSNSTMSSMFGGNMPAGFKMPF